MAEEAADQAEAAMDAQEEAGVLAAKEIKGELAAKAIENSIAAYAALQGKIQYVEAIKDKLKTAKEIRNDQETSLETAIVVDKASKKALEECKQQIVVLNNVVALANRNADDAFKVFEDSQRELMEKEQLLDATMTREEDLKLKLNMAKKDLEKTRDMCKKIHKSSEQIAKKNKRKIYQTLY